MRSWHLVVRPKAEDEAQKAARWYETESPGLGKSFLERIDQSLDVIVENPLLFQVVHRDTRRALLKQFPFSVYFRFKGDTVRIIAILHQARDPRRWQARR